jgi:hypothetical protein
MRAKPLGQANIRRSTDGTKTVGYQRTNWIEVQEREGQSSGLAEGLDGKCGRGLRLKFFYVWKRTLVFQGAMFSLVIELFPQILVQRGKCVAECARQPLS